MKQFLHVLAAIGVALLLPGASLRARPASLDINYFERCIFLKTQINGTGDYLFLLDTGASASALELKVAKKLDALVEGTGKAEGTTGVIDVKRARLNRLSAGDAHVENLTVTAQDLSGSLAPKGERIAGILGFDFLRHFRVHVDFAERRITFLQRPDLSAPRLNAVVLPMQIPDGIPRLQAKLNGAVEVDLRLDTGASLFETKDIYINATEDSWKKLVALDPKLAPEQYFRGQGAGGEVKLPVARLRELSVGVLTVARPYVIVQPRAGYFARADAVGFVSNNFLEKFSPVTIDYLDKKLVLTNNGNTK